MTMSQQKRSNKAYLNTARKARTMGSTAGNQHYNIKNWTHSKFADSLNLALRKKEKKKGEYAWDFYERCWALAMRWEKPALLVHNKQ